MCLAIPGRVVSVDQEQQTAAIDYNGLTKHASTRLAPETIAGDYVLVHAGFIIQVLAEADGAALSELAEEVGLYEN